MPALNIVPVIDLFAGPGGLGEGFSSVYNKSNRVFDIVLSIEKEQNAHETLELRSFYRAFKKGKVPEEYYRVLEEPNQDKKHHLKRLLFEKFPKEHQVAKNEAWQAELGSADFPSELVDERIRDGLGSSKDWVLIGGPPCQAYSLAGRSRVGGIDEQDHRVYLYKEYLRIIAVHHPSVFVMENVQGLLSAKVNNEKVFEWILRDLKDPSSVFKKIDSPKYRIYSLTTKPENTDLFDEPIYSHHKDFLIETEKYGIPQKRRRVILLGVREDINSIPETLKIQERKVVLKEVIGDLPKIRSDLGRSFVSSEILNGKKKRYYKDEIDSPNNWHYLVNNLKDEILKWNVFPEHPDLEGINFHVYSIGAEFVKFKTPSKLNPLFNWYNDPRLTGVCNHESRSHMSQDLKRYMFLSMFTKVFNRFPRLQEYLKYSAELLPDHKNALSGKFSDRFRVQMPEEPASTVTCHISKDGHYFIHYDPEQCRSLTVREAARIQTFPDNYLFCGSRTAQFHQVGNAVPPYLAKQIAEIVYKLMIDIK